jgi:hypothetical protein
VAALYGQGQKVEQEVLAERQMAAQSNFFPAPWLQSRHVFPVIRLSRDLVDRERTAEPVGAVDKVETEATLGARVQARHM